MVNKNNSRCCDCYAERWDIIIHPKSTDNLSSQCCISLAAAVAALAAAPLRLYAVCAGIAKHCTNNYTPSQPITLFKLTLQRYYVCEMAEIVCQIWCMCIAFCRPSLAIRITYFAWHIATSGGNGC